MITRCLHLLGIASIALATVLSSAAVEVTVRGDRIFLDGKESKLWGIRVASASQTDALADQLIAQLDDYRASGINAVAVFYQGSNAACSDPFSPDGAAIDPAHQRRLERIIRACADRGMVAVLGIFYQVKEVGGVMPPVHLRDWAACLDAVRTVTSALRGHDNVILNIANEQNSRGHEMHPWAPVRTAAGIIEACAAAKAVDPARLVGGGGYDHAINLELGLSPAVDILLFDTLGPDRQAHAGYWYDHFVANGVVSKPIVSVEMFGNWTGRFRPAGVYDGDGKAAHFREIEDALSRPALSVFLHSNNWLQGVYGGYAIRYDLGGDGTPESPGIRWYFDYLRGRLEGARPAVAATPHRGAAAWQSLATEGRPHARHDCAFVEVGDQFYLLGGHRIQPADRYDPESGRWIAMSAPPLELHGVQAVMWRRKILLAGGMSGQHPGEQPASHVWVFDPDQGTWSQGWKIPEERRRGAAGAVVVDDTLYLVGGIRGGVMPQQVTWLDALDLRSGDWRRLADAPRARGRFQAAVIDGRLFAIGGQRSSTVPGASSVEMEPEVDVFTFEEERWETWSDVPLPTPRARCMTTVVGHELYVLGGESGTRDSAHSEVEVLDTKTRTWRRAPDLLEGRSGTGVVVWQGGLHIASGRADRVGESELQSLERLDVRR
jgi:hypothetical protein